MTALTQQAMVLALLDRLFVNDGVVHICFEDDERDGIGSLVRALNAEVLEAGASGLCAEILKHDVLCLLEVEVEGQLQDLEFSGKPPWRLPDGITQAQFDSLTKYEHDFFLAMLIASQNARDANASVAWRIAAALRKSALTLSPVIRYKLAARCAAYEHEDLALHVFRWLVDMNMLATAKQQTRRPKLADNDLVAHRCAVARALLLCEFGMLKVTTARMAGQRFSTDVLLRLVRSAESPEAVYALQEMGHAVVDSWSNSGFTVFLERTLDDSESAKAILSRHARNCHWTRVVPATAARWPSLLGAALALGVQRTGRLNAPLYNEGAPERSVVAKVSERLRKLGITVYPRTIYETGRTLQLDVYPRLHAYSKHIRSIGTPPALIAEAAFQTFFACSSGTAVLISTASAS